MIRRPPRSTQSRSSAASDVYKRQVSPDCAAHTNTATPTLPSHAAQAHHCPETGRESVPPPQGSIPVSYTHLRAHETDSYLVCRLLLEKKKKKKKEHRKL